MNLCMHSRQFQPPIWCTLDHKTTQIWWLTNMKYNHLNLLWYLCCCFCCHHLMFWSPHIPNYFEQMVCPSIPKCEFLSTSECNVKNHHMFKSRKSTWLGPDAPPTHFNQFKKVLLDKYYSSLIKPLHALRSQFLKAPLRYIICHHLAPLTQHLSCVHPSKFYDNITRFHDKMIHINNGKTHTWLSN